jgi:protein-tyrosine-phosphatase
MNINQIIRCPNCGNQAERRYFTSNEAIYNSCPNHQVLQTECPVCDYLMVMCSRNARVIEAHAPGASSHGLTSYVARSSLASSLFEQW